MANMFGVNVSDIRAASQMNLKNITTNYDTSISSFLSNLAESTNSSTRMSNW